MNAMEDQLRAANVAAKQVWRDLVQVSMEEGTADQRQVVLMQGGEEITQYVSPDIVDVDLEVDTVIIDKGRPTGEGGADIPSTNVGELRAALTVAMFGVDPPLGLAWVMLIEEISAGPVEINEEGSTPEGSQTITWRVRYRRSRTDPTTGP
jgi:hypothetical protein